MPDEQCHIDNMRSLAAVEIEVVELKRRQTLSDEKLDRILDTVTETKGGIKVAKIATSFILVLLSGLTYVNWLKVPSLDAKAGERPVITMPSESKWSCKK